MGKPEARAPVVGMLHAKSTQVEAEEAMKIIFSVAKNCWKKCVSQKPFKIWVEH
jgi:hypothetical protein